MAFTDKDRQALIELVNHIQHAYSPEHSGADKDPGRITLPCRLLRAAADVTEQVYAQDLVGGLDEAEVEMLVTYLSKAVDAVVGSLRQVVAALPRQPPAEILAKLDRQADSLAGLVRERETLLSAAQSVLEREKEILEEQRRLDDLRQRHAALVRARERLKGTSLEELRREVAELEAELGPARAELEQLEGELAKGDAALTAVGAALDDARRRLGEQEKKVEDEFAKLVGVGESLVAALAPHAARCRRNILEIVREIGEKTAEGKQLREELSARLEEVGRAYDETAGLAGALKLYAQSDRQLALSLPGVMNSIRERLSRIEEELREVDAELARALAQHQVAGRVITKVSF